MQTWKHALLDNSLLTCFSLPEATPNPPQCLFLNTSPSAWMMLHASSFLLWFDLIPPSFQTATGLGLKANLGKSLAKPGPRVELILEYAVPWNLEQQQWMPIALWPEEAKRLQQKSCCHNVCIHQNYWGQTSTLLSLMFSQIGNFLLFLNSTSISRGFEPISLSV